MKKNILYLSLLFGLGSVQAAPLVNPSSEPLETFGVQGPRPNIMYVFDNSKDMKKSYSDKHMETNMCSSYNTSTNQKVLGGQNCFLNSGTITDDPLEFNTTSEIPDVLYFAYQINKTYYNPNVTYSPPVKVNSDGTLGQYANSSYTAASKDGFNTSSTINLSTGYKSLKWCDSTSASATCENSIETTATDYYSFGYPNKKDLGTWTNVQSYSNSSNCNAAIPTKATALGVPTTDLRCSGSGSKTLQRKNYSANPLNIPTSYSSNAYYYKINTKEYCEQNGVNCSSTSGTYTTEFAVRWCRDLSDATSSSLVTGTKLVGSDYVPKCVANYSDTYKYPRMGTLQKVYITTDTDKQNFANWYTYYRTRLNTLKSATGYAFKNVGSSKRVGFINTNNTGGTTTNSLSKDYLEISGFSTTQRKNFYEVLNEQTASSDGSKLKLALSKAGRNFANKQSSMTDPIRESCQQNFAILGVGSRWYDVDSSYRGLDLSGNEIGDVDGVDSGYTQSNIGAFDGKNASGTLADISSYYYSTDLRSSSLGNSIITISGVEKDVSENNVRISSKDLNSSQHMVTYIASLGLDGFLNYNRTYENNGSSYLQKIKQKASSDVSTGTTFCYWSTGTCSWPSPLSNESSAVDDLWHAAINGRGAYYKGENSDDLISGISKSINNLVSVTASSAAAATSSPNITSSNNYLFYTTYRTNFWDGDISAKTIDAANGNLSSLPVWSTREQLNQMVASASDSRTIKVFSKDSRGNPALVNFDYTALSTTEKSYFDGWCNLTSPNFSHCSLLNFSILNSGSNVIKYLRGQSAYDAYFREREYVLGDIVNSSPVFVGESLYNWTDTDYAAYKTASASKTKILVAGANDGMLHAFYVDGANAGKEAWAVIPGQVLPNMYKLADKNYSHEYYVDGNISVMDVYQPGSGRNGTWKTIMVAGLGKGGKGYFALDITDPVNPVPLWEICTNSTYCSVTDSDLGYSYGNPIITKRPSDSKWVVYVSSGYDNASGKGIVYELDAFTGAVLRKLEAVIPSVAASNQVGIGKINAFYDDFYADNKALALYAGDLNGNIWKWDLTGSTTTATLLGQATNGLSGTNEKVQPITTKIEITKIGNHRVLMFGTGKYLNEDDQDSSAYPKNSFYAIKDDLGNNALGKKIRASGGFNMQEITITASSSGVDATSNQLDQSMNWDSKDGWFFDFNSQDGELMNIDPILALGTLNVISNVPADSVCTAGGNAWYYQIDYKNGTALPNTNNVIANKVPGGFVVGQVIVKLSNGLMKNFITDSSGSVTPTAMTTNSNVISSSGSDAKRVSWREIIKK